MEVIRVEGLTKRFKVEVIPFSLEDLFVIFIEMEEQGRREAHA